MLALTENSRIKINNDSFFSQKCPVQALELSINNKNYKIKLSRGINALIGDNSIGKSMILYKITNYKDINKHLGKAYDNYMKTNKITIKTSLEDKDIRYFNYQGNIREMFNNNLKNSSDFLLSYFPENPDYSIYKTKVQEKINDFVDFLEEMTKKEKAIEKLVCLNIDNKESKKRTIKINLIGNQ